MSARNRRVQPIEQTLLLLQLTYRHAARAVQMDDTTSRIVQELNSNAEMWERQISTGISERAARLMKKRADRSRRLAEAIKLKAERMSERASEDSSARC